MKHTTESIRGNNQTRIFHIILHDRLSNNAHTPVIILLQTNFMRRREDAIWIEICQCVCLTNCYNCLTTRDRVL